MSYATIIARHTDFDPAIVEASMRAEYGTLDHLPPETFAREAKIAKAMYGGENAETGRRLALSYGLKPR